MSEASAALLKAKADPAARPAGDRVLCLTVWWPGWWLVLTTASCHLTWGSRGGLGLGSATVLECAGQVLSCVKGRGGTQWSAMLGLPRNWDKYTLLSTAGIWLPCSGSGAPPPQRGATWQRSRGAALSPTLGESWMEGTGEPLQEGTGEPLQALVSRTTPFPGVASTAMWMHGRGGLACPDPSGWRSLVCSSWRVDPIGISCWVSSLERRLHRTDHALLPSGPRLETFRTLLSQQPALPASPAALLYYGDKEAEGPSVRPRRGR